MLSLLATVAPLLLQDPSGGPDGARLSEARNCYTIHMTRDGASRPIGVSWQTVTRGVRDGRPVLEVTVHQSGYNGAFDMRDEFVLDAATLRPLLLVNRRNGTVHVRATYSEDRITGERTAADGTTTPIDVPLPEPVWEGNLYGLTFAALPLAQGAEFSLPYWQYDKGFGRFSVRVTGSQMVETSSGPIEAWVVEASTRADRPIVYLIGKTDNREISHSAALGSQTPGGDCSALEGRD